MAENIAHKETSAGIKKSNYTDLESHEVLAFENINIEEGYQERNDKSQPKTRSVIRKRTVVVASIVVLVVIIQIATIIILGLHMSNGWDHKPEPSLQSLKEVEELRQETISLIGTWANSTQQEISFIKDSVAEVRIELSNLTDSFEQENALNQCPSNWIVRGKSCYHFSHDVQTWADAMAICGLFKSHLVVVNDNSENSFITSIRSESCKISSEFCLEYAGTFFKPTKVSSYRRWACKMMYLIMHGVGCLKIMYSDLTARFAETDKDRRFWIGLNDLVEEGTWKWLDSNARPNYLNWAPGEPNNKYNLENCVHFKNTLGEWNDIKCNNLEYYVCEIELL